MGEEEKWTKGGVLSLPCEEKREVVDLRV